jgi:hypothetical protein
MNGLVDVGGECLNGCAIEFSRRIDATRYGIDQFMDLRTKAQDEVLGGIGPELVQTSGEFRRRPKRLSHGLKERRVEVDVVGQGVPCRFDEWKEAERVAPGAQGPSSGPLSGETVRLLWSLTDVGVLANARGTCHRARIHATRWLWPPYRVVAAAK